MALWTVHGDGRHLAEGDVVAPGERLSWPRTISFGLQHAVTMFGATLLVPLLTGLPPTTTLLFSGLGTLLFLVITRNRVPCYLGSSQTYVAPLMANQAASAGGRTGGLLVSGVLITMVGVAVKALGARLVESIMPPVVTGAVVILIGFNLAPIAVQSFNNEPGLASLTLFAVLLASALLRGFLSRIAVLIGVVTGWVLAAVSDNLDAGRLAAVHAADWVGLPPFVAPEFRPEIVLSMLPAVIVLVAENLGHVKAIAAMTGRNLDGSAGDALIGNGLATALAGAGGGSGTTTYAENIGVMAATRVFSTAAYVIAAVTALLLSFSPKFGALVNTIPSGVLGGASMVLYGLIGLVGVRIWVENKIDLNDPVNLMVAGAALVAGIGNLTLTVFGATIGGIAWGSLLIIVLHPLMRALNTLRKDPASPPTTPST
ncbi:uracil-xanthine permease family protein [Allokutzneria oryzae]|uniref:Uracil-xanthine permease family protein n=1 Tax=Allokutzneria oryzae TaxID=1378989 RepID=A0ABV6A6J1_9PSEU